ncbi:LPXTG cell wall anchor domain-containing protein [Enterococcus sp. HY326]|uniref:LPXTG cell wall anchor domain-containing protein n=1 Tax=Enterococcus sp. HY326 TaxID=2971265 RepID=UPI002240A60B|nr:LPXTG cell wall anchor domain-containing protein [Enterococcus sp. HY326]
MKLKLKVFFFSCLVIILIGMLPLRAAATTGNGGQGTVEGGITFYEESTNPSSSTSTSLPSTGGKLPQTGDQIRNYSVLGGGILLLALLFFFYRRRKKEKEERE